MNDTQNMLTAKDIQEYFGCGKNQAYALMHSRGFPAIQINRRLYVPQEELDKWIARQTGRTYLI